MECVFFNGSGDGGGGENEETSIYDKIYNDYHSVHGYIASILCCFGLLANACNILVLTRSEMFSTINMLLTSIAVCDSTLMVSYIIYLAHFQLSTFSCSASKYTFGWAVFTVIHADLSVASRACSLWLSVVMAALRSHILSRHQVLLLQSRYIANKRLGYKLIWSTVGAVFLMTIPVFINHTIEPIQIRPIKMNNSIFSIRCPKVAWIVVPPAITLEHDCLMLKIGYWTNGLLLKLIPCILLSYYLVKLIHFIRIHMRHSQSKFGERETVNSLKPTTFLLSTILFVTLICELPNALASLLSGVRSFAFGVMIYKSLGDIFDLLALVNGITSFILYCSMSQMFRETFLNILCDIRDYFTIRSRDYYRRWSTNVFGTSQSTAEFSQHQPQFENTIQNGGTERSTFAHFEQSPNGGRQLSVADLDIVSSDQHRLLGSFDGGLNSRDMANHQRLGPSPSSSSEKLLNEENIGNKKKKFKKQQNNDIQLPLFDYANLTVKHSGTSLVKKKEIRQDDENLK